MRDDRGDIVLGWLTKLTVVLSLLAVVGFEFVSLGLARLSVQDVANSAAREASQNYRQNRNVQLAYKEAVAVAAERDVTIRPEEFSVETDGTVVLTARKTANSMIFHRFGSTEDWLDASAQGRARFVP